MNDFAEVKWHTATFHPTVIRPLRAWYILSRIYEWSAFRARCYRFRIEIPAIKVPQSFRARNREKISFGERRGKQYAEKVRGSSLFRGDDCAAPRSVVLTSRWPTRNHDRVSRWRNFSAKCTRTNVHRSSTVYRYAHTYTTAVLQSRALSLSLAGELPPADASGSSAQRGRVVNRTAGSMFRTMPHALGNVSVTWRYVWGISVNGESPRHGRASVKKLEHGARNRFQRHAIPAGM